MSFRSSDTPDRTSRGRPPSRQAITCRWRRRSRAVPSAFPHDVRQAGDLFPHRAREAEAVIEDDLVQVELVKDAVRSPGPAGAPPAGTLAFEFLPGAAEIMVQPRDAIGSIDPAP